MINPFSSIPHRFFHNAIAWPELNFIFKLVVYLSYKEYNVAQEDDLCGI